MPEIVCPLAALSVAAIFYTYRAYLDRLKERQRLVRERVTYLLWSAAQFARD